MDFNKLTHCPSCGSDWIVADLYGGVRLIEALRFTEDMKVSKMVEGFETIYEDGDNFNRSILTLVSSDANYRFLSCPDCNESWNIDTEKLQHPKEVYQEEDVTSSQTIFPSFPDVTTRYIKGRPNTNPLNKPNKQDDTEN